MPLNYELGSLDEALHVIDHEGPGELTNYEKMNLAIELLKVSAIKDAAESAGQIASPIKEGVDLYSLK